MRYYEDRLVIKNFEIFILCFLLNVNLILHYFLHVHYSCMYTTNLLSKCKKTEQMQLNQPKSKLQT